MDEKIKELIAIGASISGHCQPCLKYHIGQAVSLGISIEDINSAILVGKTVEKGALKAMDDFSKEHMESLTASSEKIESKKTEGCCCDDSCKL